MGSKTFSLAATATCCVLLAGLGLVGRAPSVHAKNLNLCQAGAHAGTSGCGCTSDGDVHPSGPVHSTGGNGAGCGAGILLVGSDGKVTAAGKNLIKPVATKPPVIIPPVSEQPPPACIGDGCGTHDGSEKHHHHENDDGDTWPRGGNSGHQQNSDGYISDDHPLEAGKPQDKPGHDDKSQHHPHGGGNGTLGQEGAGKNQGDGGADSKGQANSGGDGKSQGNQNGETEGSSDAKQQGGKAPSSTQAD